MGELTITEDFHLPLQTMVTLCLRALEDCDCGRLDDQPKAQEGRQTVGGIISEDYDFIQADLRWYGDVTRARITVHDDRLFHSTRRMLTRFLTALHHYVEEATSPDRPRTRTLTPVRSDLRVFLSYRRSDTEDVSNRLYDRLAAHFGTQSVFKDVDSMPAGKDFRRVIADVLAGCDAVLVLIGPSWLRTEGSGERPRLFDQGDYVRWEVKTALGRDMPVVPVLVDGAHIPQAQELPPSIRDLINRHAVEVRNDSQFHDDVDRLLVALGRATSRG